MTTAELPLLARHREAGAVLGEQDGWQVPLSYGNRIGEHTAVRTGCGVRDVSYRTRLRLSGADRTSWFHGMCTQNIKALKPGSGAPACCINDIGRLLFDMVVYVRADEILLELDGPLRDKAMEWLDRHVITEDVVVEDVSNQFLALELAGPTAVSAFPGLPEAPFGVADHEGAILLGSHGTGTATWQLWVRPGRIDTLWSQLHAKARPYGLEAWETLRQEAGHPVYGQDMDEENNPLEADLHAAVSLDKGCYTGQEVMARLTFRQGPVRSRMGLRSSELLARGEELLWQDKPMARVSSSTQSPTLGYPIAMGYVRRECKAPGTALRRANGGTVEVVDVPWVK